MEFAAAAMSAISAAIGSTAVVGSEVAASAAAAAGTTVTSAGATGAGWLAGAGSSISSILQGTASVASILGAMGKGSEESDALKARAGDAAMEAQLEGIKGTERRTGLRKSLIDALSERDVAAAASGVDLSFGTPAMARDEALRDGERALVADQSTQDLRVSRLQERQAELLKAASQSRRSGLLKAFGEGTKLAASFSRRG